MPEVARTSTSLTPSEAVELIAQSFFDLTGAWPGSRVLALLAALSDLETGTWRSMGAWNFGNIIATEPNKQRWFVANDSGNLRKFRAYDSAADGAQGFVRQLLRDSRKGWREGLLTGNPTEFVDALAGDRDGIRYFEAARDRYLGTFLARHERYARPVAVAGALDDGSVMPLYPAQVQTWVVALPYPGGQRAKAAATDTQVTALLEDLWPSVQALIPGPTSSPRRIDWSRFDEDDKGYAVLEFARWLPPAPDPDWIFAPIQFDYVGTERRMPWFEVPLRVTQVWQIEDHVPESRVHSWLRTMWEAARLAGEDLNEAADDLVQAGKKAASGIGFGLGLAAGAALLLFWLNRKQKRKG